VRFQVEARKARREAEEANKKKIQWWIEVSVLVVCFIIGIAALGIFVWWLYQRNRAAGGA
jgi:flagellar basal body-associated protein FliL